MPHHHFARVCRQRGQYTGEGLRRAAAALKQQSPEAPTIPVATYAQAQLELELLRVIGRGTVTATAGWKPGGAPLGIDWVTPHHERLDIGVKQRFLPGLLRAALPRYIEDGHEPWGICGLRFRLARGAVELSRMDLPGKLRLCGVTASAWWQALNAMLAECHDDGIPRDTAVWIDRRDRFHPVEEEFARLSSPGYCPEGARSLHGQLAKAASDLLRHHHAFAQTPFMANFDVWMNPGAIEVEWYDGPTHGQIITALIKPGFGMSITTGAKHCPDCSTDQCPYSIPVYAHDGSRINLRRNIDGWDQERETAARKLFKRRMTLLNQFVNSTQIAPPEPTDCSGAAQPQPAATTAAKPLTLAERLDNSRNLAQAADISQPASVRLACAHNAFIMMMTVSYYLSQYGSPRRSNYDTAEAIARDAAMAIVFTIGLETIHRHGRVPGTVPIDESEFDQIEHDAQMELYLSGDDDIEALAGRMISLAAAAEKLLDNLATDNAAQPFSRKLATKLQHNTWEIHAHYGGDGGGW